MIGSISDKGNYSEDGEPCKDKGSLVVLSGEFFPSKRAEVASEQFSFNNPVLVLFSPFAFGVTDFLIARTDLTPRLDC